MDSTNMIYPDELSKVEAQKLEERASRNSMEITDQIRSKNSLYKV